MNMANEVISTIMGALGEVFSGFGTSLTTLFSTLIYDGTTGLTVFAEWTLVFAGFAMGTGILYALLNKVL